jgi:predicted ATPase
MLRRIKVDGYKGLRGTSLELKQDGLTVLLGPNGSGKSSIFGAIRLLREATEPTGLREGHVAGEHFADFVTGGDTRNTISLEAEVYGPPIAWRVVLGKRNEGGSLQVLDEQLSDGDHTAVRGPDGNLVVNGNPVDSRMSYQLSLCGQARSYPGFRDNTDQDGWRILAAAVNESLGPVRLAQLNPVRLAQSVPLGEPVGIDGYGLPAQLLHLSSTRRKVFAEIQDRFCELFSWVEEIELPTVQGLSGMQGPQGYTTAPTSSVELRFREKGVERSYPAREMASGMLLALALLWMVYRPDGDRIVCFDEPENSVHPHLLRYVYGILKGLTRPENGRASVHVVVATHSVDFVNLCEPDEIRICERSDDGSVQIESVKDKKDLAQALDTYRGAMGELWFSGALGGLPSHGAKSSRTG